MLEYELNLPFLIGSCMFCGSVINIYRHASKSQVCYVCSTCLCLINDTKGLMTERNDIRQWIFKEDLK